MVSYTLILVLQVIVLIFGMANVTCDNVKDKCLHEINNVFGDQSSPFKNAKFAMQYLKHDMPILRENNHAQNYYYELKKHLTAGNVSSPKYYWKYSAETRNDLESYFGVTPYEVVHHAYLYEILQLGSKSAVNVYMKHIIEKSDVDDKDTMLCPLKFCEKEQVESLCRMQIQFAFSNCDNVNDCLSYAMKSLKRDYNILLDNEYAFNYYDALRNRLDEVSFIALVEDPVTYFNKFLHIMNDDNLHTMAIDTANKILERFRGNKLAFVTHVYNYEIMDERDYSLYQFYVRHVYEQCDGHDFQTLGDFSPEYYCLIVRQNTN